MDLYRAANSYLAGIWYLVPGNWYQTAVKPTGYEINYIAHISRIKHLVNLFLCPATIGFVVICNAVVYICHVISDEIQISRIY